MATQHKFKKFLTFKPWAIIFLPISEKNGALFPFLTLNNGKPSIVATLFANSLSQEGWSDETIIKHLQAIGRFYALCLSEYGENPVPKSEIHSLFGKYAEKRFRGSIDANGNDGSGLFWSRINFSSVIKEITCLNKYSDFSRRYLGFIALNPVEENVNNCFKYYKDLRDQGRSDAMIHLSGVRKGHKKYEFELNPLKISTKNKTPKYINTLTLIELIDQGCKSPRDKMLLILMGFGGLRISESLHIYLDDVTSIFPTTQASKVKLFHPSEGVHTWNDGKDWIHGTRAEYLSHAFKRLPRNELGKGHLEYAGWKGMLLDQADPELNYIFWLEEIIVGTFFRKLLNQYLLENRGLLLSNQLKHPYLFFNTRRTINQDNYSYGHPMSLMNAHEVFSSACKRIKLNGYSPHSCRHHYGFYSANVIKVAPETLQRQLRHRQITSTDIYYHRDPASIRHEISMAISDQSFTQDVEGKPDFPSHWSYL